MTGSRAGDYSRIPIAYLTAQLEDSLFRHTDIVETDPRFGGLLAHLHGLWFETIANHPDPVGALIREVEDNGGFPDFAAHQIFGDEAGGIDLLSLLIFVNMRRPRHGRAAGTGDPAEQP
ncbi:hypothetical protein [Nocardia pseudovaccinii]|uniref:hypothetical protein n=1 Tax=Nocardia pseudovaccinii TaxID=189540 RepID=UPI0007A43FD6|nr:hypothetical protein [Nocardia pseudovaccinii]